MVFIENKYSSWYAKIISNAQNRLPLSDEYVEKHHVVPRCLGGTDEPSNIVELSGREHFVCHLLLCKMTEGGARSSLCYALLQMSRTANTKRYKPSSRVYSMMRTLLSESIKGKTFEERYGTVKASEVKQKFKNRVTSVETKKRQSNSARNMSAETKRKIGEKSKGRTHNVGRKLSEDTKRKISGSLAGRKREPFSEETRKKMSDTRKGMSINHNAENNPMFGKSHRAQTKELISKANCGENNGMFGRYKNSPTIVCPHCKKTGKEGPNFIRWHFDNCKVKPNVK